MGTYILQFGVYTLAMVGVIFVSMLVVKKTMTNGKFAKNNNQLCIENVLNLSQRKTLYIIKVGVERFLIAGDTERTSFLAKLDGEGSIPFNSAFDMNTLAEANTTAHTGAKAEADVKFSDNNIMDVLAPKKEPQKEYFNEYVEEYREEPKQVNYMDIMAALQSSTPANDNSKQPVMREIMKKLSA